MPSESMKWTTTVLSAGQGAKVPPQMTSPGGTEELLEKALSAGIPSQNFLMLITEVADKRKRFFKLLKKDHTVVDLSVDTGSSRDAKESQREVLLELIRNTLAKYDKKISTQVAELLIERVGFHPVAAVMETEKLALYSGDSPGIERQDLDALVGRTRQEALFELTGALGHRNLERAILLADRLRDNGIHELAIIATLRNYSRKLLLFRSLLQQPRYGYSNSISASAFKDQCLPKLKEPGTWNKELAGHPYALYMQFKTANSFKIATLKSWLVLLLSAEQKIKSSALESSIIIQHLIVAMLANPTIRTLKK